VFNAGEAKEASPALLRSGEQRHSISGEEATSSRRCGMRQQGCRGL